MKRLRRRVIPPGAVPDLIPVLSFGNTNCHYPDGTWTQCDENGNDCWITPPARPPVTTLDPNDGTIGEVTTDHGKTSATAPETVGPTVAADHDEKPAKAKSKRSKGKKRKK